MRGRRRRGTAGRGHGDGHSDGVARVGRAWLAAEGAVSAFAAVVATGMHLPELEVTNGALRARVPAEHHGDLDRFAEVSGIRTRFHAPDDWATSDLAVPACRQALERAGVA